MNQENRVTKLALFLSPNVITRGGSAFSITSVKPKNYGILFKSDKSTVIVSNMAPTHGSGGPVVSQIHYKFVVSKTGPSKVF